MNYNSSSQENTSPNLNINPSFNTEKYWEDAWVNHLEAYLKAPPRCGIWLQSNFHLRDKKVLECAGGSCRDSRYLANSGLQAVGSDFDQKTISYLKQRFPDQDFLCLREDAFSMSFEDKSFDIVFHNGFWVCFPDNSHLFRLLLEQTRVAKFQAIALVHNGLNSQLIDSFAEKSKSDDLYKIRFFKPHELIDICEQSGLKYRKISLKKFGGKVDILYALVKKVPLLKPVLYWLIPKLYQFQPWSSVERIALIIDL